MKKLTFAILLLLGSTSFAQKQDCFSASDLNDTTQAQICIQNLGEKLVIAGSGYFTGFTQDKPVAGFEQQNFEIKESSRGYTAQGAPVIHYGPVRLLDQRNVFFSVVCVEEFGIQFIADIETESGLRNFIDEGKGFVGCNKIWAQIPPHDAR